MNIPLRAGTRAASPTVLPSAFSLNPFSRHSHILCLCLCLCLFFAPAALADQREVTPSIALQQEYNDNVYFSARSRKADLVTTLSPALTLLNNTERLQAGLKLQWDSASYYDNPALDSIDQEYSGSVRYAVSPLMRLSSSADYRSDSRIDRDFSQTGLLQGPVRRERYTFALGGEYALSEEMEAQLNYSFAGEYYESPVYTDQRSHDLSFALERDLSRLLPRTRGRLHLGMTSFDDQYSQVYNYSATMGIQRSWDERFSVFADLGPRYTRSSHGTGSWPDPGERQSTGFGLSGQAGVTYKGERDNASLVFSHNVTAASGRSGTVERTALQGHIGRNLNESSRLSLSAGYAANSSSEDTPQGQATDEMSLWLQPKLSYSLNDDLALEASYNYALVHNRQADSEAQRNLLMLRLVFRYELID